jgi:hypothetical protein
MAALTYNASTTLSTSLKKYIKWSIRQSVIRIMELNNPLNAIQNDLKMALKSIISHIKPLWNLYRPGRRFIAVNQN